MIIGIDESGTFSLDSKGVSIFAGIHILDEASLARIASKFEVWKTKYKSFKNNKGEIKSTEMTENMATELVKEVLLPEYFFITVSLIKPADHKKKHIQDYRDVGIKAYNTAIEKCLAVDNASLARQYTELRNWYKNLNYQLIIKESVLGQMIGHSFHSHVIKVALERKDQSLGLIRISIDRDFVREPSHITFWKEILRNTFHFYTERNPIPVISEWGSDHPFFMSKKNDAIGIDTVNDEDDIFRNGVNFERSDKLTELQLADLVAGIISRYLNEKTHKEAFDVLRIFMIPPNDPFLKLRIGPTA